MLLNFASKLKMFTVEINGMWFAEPPKNIQVVPNKHE